METSIDSLTVTVGYDDSGFSSRYIITGSGEVWQSEPLGWSVLESQAFGYLLILTGIIGIFVALLFIVFRRFLDGRSEKSPVNLI